MKQFMTKLVDLIQDLSKGFIGFEFEVKSYDNETKMVLYVNWLPGDICKEIFKLAEVNNIIVTNILPEVGKVKFYFSENEE